MEKIVTCSVTRVTPIGDTMFVTQHRDRRSVYPTGMGLTVPITVYRRMTLRDTIRAISLRETSCVTMGGTQKTARCSVARITPVDIPATT